MIKFHIPWNYNLDKIDLTIINLLKNHKKYFYDDISIAGIYGVFAPCIWTAGRTITGINFDNNKRQEIISQYNKLNISFIYVFTNTSLDERLLADYICNDDIKNILNSADINKIIIADEKLKHYIQTKYSLDFKFILSTTSAPVLRKNLNDLKKLEQEYILIVPNYNFNNTEELLNISNPSKYEILLNPQCIENCPYEAEHYQNISDMIVGKAHTYFQCPFEANLVEDLEGLQKLKSFITVEDLYTKYKDKGFETFKINGRTALSYYVVQYYLYYMVKPEYQNTVFEYFKDMIEPMEEIEKRQNGNINESR